LIFVNAQLIEETIKVKMRPRLRLAVIGGAVLLSVLFCNFAQATDSNYATIGWWQIIYREVSDLNGCQATARFEDQTEIVIALIQNSNSRSWHVFIYNPKWESWVRRKSEQTLIIVAINPTKIWRGPWGVSSNSLNINASVDFIKSIADAKSLAIFDENERLLTSRPLNMKDSENAIRSVVTCIEQHAPISKQPPPPETYSGTAFFVAPNFLLTNNHVVGECGNNIQVNYADQRSYAATIFRQDATNDLALLKTNMSGESIATFRLRTRLGETVATFGFPYSDLLSSSGTFTTGTITSLRGLRNDSRFISMQVPVQPGNSGGPLLEMSGSVIGVVTGRLSAQAMMGGELPQNVNFAIKASVVDDFLSAQGVTSKLDNSDLRQNLPPADVADIAKKFTVQVYCETGPAKISEAPPASTSPLTADERRAKEFALALQARWSRPNTETLAGLDALYKDEVMYFGKMTKKAAVIKEKQAFAQKFPVREYKPKEPIFVQCSEGVCIVRGLVDFRAVDPVAKILSEGVATFEYQLILSATAIKISLETGEVKSRTRTPLAGARASQPYSSGDGALQLQLYSGASAAQQYRDATRWQTPQ
jgi:S1-C subfamily serine protease